MAILRCATCNKFYLWNKGPNKCKACKQAGR